MSDELKPVRCGCGGNWAIVMGRHPVAKYIYWYVRCEDCGTRTDEYDTKEQAIEAWNTAMSGVVLHPSTTPDGAYTSGCTITNTTDPNKDFHPVRDFMVGIERMAKVVKHDASITITDGYKYKRSEYLCSACKKKVLDGDDYCSHCGARLEWV